jgi:hypothetical protein
MENLKYPLIEQNNLFMKVHNERETLDNIFCRILNCEKLEKTKTQNIGYYHQKVKIDDKFKSSSKIFLIEKTSNNKMKKIDFEMFSHNISSIQNLDSDNYHLNISNEISKKQQKFEKFSEFQKKKIHNWEKMHKNHNDNSNFCKYSYFNENFHIRQKENIKMKKIENLSQNVNMTNFKEDIVSLNEDIVKKMSLNYLTDVKKLEELYENKNMNEDSFKDLICCICDLPILENIGKSQEYDILKQTNNKIFTLNCSHSFHKFCFIQWFNVKKICPLCRKDVNINFNFPFENNCLINFEDINY